MNALRETFLELIAPHTPTDVLLWFLTFLVGTAYFKGILFRAGGRLLGAMRTQPGKVAAEILKLMDGTTAVSNDGKEIDTERCSVHYNVGKSVGNRRELEEFTVLMGGQMLQPGQLKPWEETRIKRKHGDVVREHRRREAETLEAQTLKRLRGG